MINETELEFEAAGVIFKAKAKQIVKKGWRDIQEWFFVAKKEETEDSDDERILDNLTFFEEGKTLPARDPEVKEGKTAPKKHFTDEAV